MIVIRNVFGPAAQVEGVVTNWPLPIGLKPDTRIPVSVRVSVPVVEDVKRPDHVSVPDVAFSNSGSSGEAWTTLCAAAERSVPLDLRDRPSSLDQRVLVARLTREPQAGAAEGDLHRRWSVRKSAYSWPSAVARGKLP